VVRNKLCLGNFEIKVLINEMQSYIVNFLSRKYVMRSCQTCQKLKWLHKKANVQELFGHQAKEKLETIFEKKKKDN